MNTSLCRPVRAGFILSTVVALLAFAARLVEAQPPTPHWPTSSQASVPATHAPHANVGATAAR